MNKKGNYCPYWDRHQGYQCKIAKGGLYIPMPQQVECYCSNPNYIRCPQYIRGHAYLQDRAGKHDFLMQEDRRRNLRIAENIILSLSSCDEEGGTFYPVDEKARITDLSLGGFRVEADGELHEGGLVSFNFGDGFSYPDMAGKGEVRWCEHRQGRERCRAGVAFTDVRLSRAVGEHLGLPLH